MARRFVVIITTLFVYLILPLLLPILLVSHAWRFVASKFLVKFVPNSGKILTCRSSLSGTDGIYTLPKYSLVVVSVFEGPEPLDNIRKAVRLRLIHATGSNGELIRPEFQQFVSSQFGFLFWKNETNFEIEQHVRFYDGKYAGNFQVVTPELLTLIASELAYKPFSPGTSPWEALVLPNYRESPTSPNSTVIILHIHHSLGDGYSILRLTLDFLRPESNVTQNKINKTRLPKQRLEIWRYLKTISLAICAPHDLVSTILDSTDCNSWHLPERELRQTINSALSPKISIHLIKELKTFYKVSFNCIIMECFASALSKYMTTAGYSVPAFIHCAVPLPMSKHPSDKMRNHLTACYVKLPVGSSCTKERLEAIERDLLRNKQSTFPLTLFYTMGLFGGLFTALLRPLVKNNRTTALMSNFPGPSVELNFLGHKLSSLFFGGGLHNGSCGIGFSAVSSCDQMRFVFALDEGLVSINQLPASHLVNFFMEALDNLQIRAV